MITFTRDGLKLERNVMKFAGGLSQLLAGIEGARRELGIGGRLSPEKALEFWTQRIYRPAREGLLIPRRFKKNIRGRNKTAFDYVGYATMKYNTTIEARLTSWGSQAPYWIWLDKGGGGYPPGKPTGFIFKSQERINSLFRANIEAVAREFSDAISNEISSFLRNPQSYEPGQFIDEVVFEGRRFRVGVSPTGEISIRSIE